MTASNRKALGMLKARDAEECCRLGATLVGLVAA